MRKKQKKIPSSLIAMIVASFAGLVGYNFLSSSPAPAIVKETIKVVTKKAPTIEIIVANKNIQIGKRITIDDIAWRQWPEDLYNHSFIKKSTDDSKSLEKIVGSIARFPLNEGEPIVSDKIITPNDRSNIVSLLRQGMRAISVKISAENGAGGFISPGDIVDVIFTSQLNLEGKEDANINDVAGFVSQGKIKPEIIKPKELHPDNKNFPSEHFYQKLNKDKKLFVAGADKYTETLLKNVKILAVDKNVSPPSKTPDAEQATGATATLEVTSAQAELLAWAESTGTLTIILRSVYDNSVSENENQMDILPETSSEYAKALNRSVPYGGASNMGGQNTLSVFRSSNVSKITTSSTHNSQDEVQP